MSRAVRVETGLARLVANEFRELDGLRIGLIGNPSTVDDELRHAADLMHASSRVKLVRLFGPEHGIRGDAQDMIGVSSGVDTRTGCEVVSLYGPTVDSLRPRPEHLEGLDALVFDVQDVGSRYYTFAATMMYAMEAAAEAGLRFFVLDRPNPIGGELVEGPTVRPGFESFVGAYPMAIRHGMTVGEIARMFRAERRVDVDLTVVECRGWQRSMGWGETGLDWVLPSPNMPTPDTALVYPGGCLVEGTNLSEGRGTTRPFEICGAPWIDAEVLSDRLRSLGLRGCRFRACTFRPTFQKHAGLACGGVQVHVTDARLFRPVEVYSAFLIEARAMEPDRFRWRTETYEYVSDPIAIDLLFGSSREREAIEAGADVFALSEGWAREEAEFRERRAEFLIYN